jgi:hypothetical protein
MHDNSIIAIGEVDHKSWLYKFTNFFYHDSFLLLTHADESSRLWHEIFGDLNFKYMR